MQAESISPSDLKGLLTYDASSGRLFWKARKADHFSDGAKTAAHVCAVWNSKHAGKEAFTSLNGHGRRTGRIFGQTYYAHRVIWALVSGSWPPELVDHKDGDPTNNRWGNLRLASCLQNSQNRASSAGATSSFIGVSLRRDGKTAKWAARIKANGSEKWLGTFPTEASAAEAYDAAALLQHGEYARLNFAVTQ